MKPVLLQQEKGVAFITLNRPDKMNAFNREMALLLQQTLDECGSDDAVRCICITGSGKAFSAGQDLAEVADSNGPGMSRILSEHYNPIIMRIRNMPKPIIAAVNAVAAGAGANIALACDIVVAAQSASFIQAFSKIGLIPDSGGTYFLPRLTGFQRASGLMMMGDKITAAEAWQMGMLYKLLDDASFDREVRSIAEKLANMPTQALAYIKQALQESQVNNLSQQLQAEDRLQQKAAATADFAEGVAAFLEKRPPVFTGK